MATYKVLSIIRGFFIRILVNLFHKDSHISKGFRIGKNCQLCFRNNGKMIIGKNVVLANNVKLSVVKNGIIDIQDDVGINDYCQLVAHEQIAIGAQTNIAPFVCFFDHNHKFKNGVIKNEYSTSPIIVGKNCWIGANSVVLKGSIIGNGCIVGAGSTINFYVEDNTLIVQKKNSTKINLQK